MRRRTLLGLALLGMPLTVAGCGSDRGDVVAAETGPDLPVDLDALGYSDKFPASQLPRPIVLTGPAVTEAGFSDAATKLAAANNGYSLTLPLPAAATTTTRRPDGTLVLPQLSGADAAARLPLGNRPDAAGAVPATSAGLGTATYATDRGLAELPTWLFTVRNRLGPFTVPTLDDTGFWRPPGDNGQQPLGELTGATRAADDLSVRVQPPAIQDCGWGPLPRYAAQPVETSTSVAIGCRVVGPGTRNSCNRPVPTSTVQLAAPDSGHENFSWTDTTVGP